jgi:ferrochelatase
MAHGTPNTLEEMPEYLVRVRGGRPASPELVAEMRKNYEAIGGRSPLTAISRAQAAALQERLGPEPRVLLGMRTWHPLIADVLRPLTRATTDRVIGIPLTPQFSTMSVQKYGDAASAALATGIEFDCIRSYHDHPLLVAAFADRLAEALAAHPSSSSSSRETEEVIFTAHSVPTRVITAGDPYADEVATTARLVAAKSGVASYHVAYQSMGRTPEPWIGPDLAEMIRSRAAAGVEHLLVVPIGFVCDHTEILFDIDVQAAELARSLGVTLRRTASLNTQPAFIELLATLVRDALAGEAGPTR